jgi:hypothetical protein
MTSLTVEDSESSYLKGKAEFDEWKQQFMVRWYMPRIVDYLGTLVNTMPVESRMIAPTETAMIEKMYHNMRGG